MNDTTNTTPGVGAMPGSSTPPASGVPETPIVQPFAATSVNPAPVPSAPAATSFGTADQSSTQTPPASPSWAATPSSAPAANSFATPAPTPVAGSASWGAPAPDTASTTAPSWGAPAATPVASTAPMNPPVAPASSDFKPEHEGKSKLPLVIAGILLILAMAGGYFLYMLYQTPTTSESTVPAESQAVPTEVPSPTMTEEEQAQQEINALENVSDSDEVESLQQDVDNTDLNNIDSGLTPAAQ